jgi:protein TonB
MKTVLFILTLLISSTSFAQGKKQRYTCNEDSIFVIVDKMPEFPGGELALRKFIAENIKYPEDLPIEEVNIGKIYVEFCVDKKGKVERAKIIRSVHPKLDLEALRVINKLPRWTPGMHKGQPVCVYYTIPINIRWE